MSEKKIATREAYGEALREAGKKNKDIVVLDADLSKSTKTSVFAEAFPERFLNIGISEQDLIGTAAGLAAAGKLPFASTFAVFATGRAFEQIRNSVAYSKLKVVVAASHAGITVGEDGGSHQSIEDISLMRSLPNMTVIVPADATETAKAVEAVVEHPGPVYLRLGRLGVPVIFPEDYQFTIGKAALLKEGQDATIIATGIMVAEALKAAEKLQEKGLSIRVVNMHTIKPLDQEAVIAAARETGAIVTAEEHNIIGGLGSAVAEVLAENYPAPLERVGVQDVFGESGTPAELLEKFGLTANHLVEAVEKVIKRK